MSARMVLLAAVMALAAPASASAEHDDVKVPKDAPVVAGPLPSGASLVAFGHRGSVCVAIRGGNQEPQASCIEPPNHAADAGEVYAFDEVTAHGGVVFADVAQVDLRFAEKATPRALPRDRGVLLSTVAGEAYRGPGVGRVRFYLGDGPRDTPWLRRYLGADGRTLGADDHGFERPVIGRPVTLAAGRGDIRLRAVRSPKLAATPLDRGRLVEQVCVDVVSGEREGGGICTSPDDPLAKDLNFVPATVCDRLQAPVVTTRRVSRVEAVLGDGRRARVALVDVPPGLMPNARAGALVVNGPVAVRRLEAFGAGGRRVSSLEVRQAPPEPCGEGISSSFAAFAQETSPDRGPLGLRIRDEGARLCLSLDDFDADLADCVLPPVDPEQAGLLLRRGAGRTMIAAVLPREVATVEIVVDGAARRVETTPDLPGYGGQYRDVARFLLLELPGSPKLGAARFLDAAGAELADTRVIDLQEPTARSTRTVAVGGMRLRLTDYAGLAGLQEPFACVRPVGRPAEECTPATTYFATIDALCSPRRLLVVGEAPRGTRAVALRLASGRTRSAKLVRIGDRRLYLAALRPDDALRRIVIRGRAVRTANVRLPPVARQCGYDAYGFAQVRGRDTDLGESSPEIARG